MNNCYVCNGSIDYKNGEWSPLIINNIAYKKCGTCTTEKNYVLSIDIELKDITAFRKVLTGFSFQNYIRDNKVNIVYSMETKVLLYTMLSDIGFVEVENIFLIGDTGLYSRVINSFKK